MIYLASTSIQFLIISQISEKLTIYTMQTNGSYPPQQRPKEPSQLQLRNLKIVLHKLTLPSNHNVYYNIATKQSKSGFFNNDRLILLNTKDKCLAYASKLPQGLIPLLTEDEVRSLKFKSKVTREQILNGEVKDFKCHQLPGKLSTLEVFYKRGNRNEIQQWYMTLGNPKLMYQWIQLINNTILKDEPPPQKPQDIAYQPPPFPQVYQEPKTESKKVLNDDIHPKPASDYKQPKQQAQQPVTYDIKPETYHQAQADPKQQTRNVNQSIVHVSNISYEQQQPIQSSRIANLPYSDHVSELKYLKNVKPELFKLKNELSNKNLQDQGQNSNTLNVHPQPKVQYNRIFQEDNRNRQQSMREKGGSRYYLENNPKNTPAEENVSVYQRERQGSKNGLSSSQIVADSFKKSQSRAMNPPVYDPQHKLQNTQYRRQDDSDLPQPQPQIKISSSNLRYGNDPNSQLYQAFQNPITYSRNNLDPYNQSVRAQSRSNIVLEQSKYSRSDIGIARKESLKNIQSRAVEQKQSQLRPENVMTKSNYLSKASHVSSGKGFSSRGLARRKWNEVFAQTSNKLQIYQQFIQTCFNIVRQIVNELPLDTNRRQYLPIEAKSPFFTYYNEGIILTLHHFEKQKNISKSQVLNAPVLYDQTTYQILKRQFYNYNLLLSVTGNEGFIKVPLCAYFQYKGVLALCKAEIPDSFSEITPKRYEKQFEIIQNQIHLRFIFGSFNAYLQQNQKYIILDNMKELIPEIPLGSREHHYFRKQFLLHYDRMLQDRQTCSQAHDQVQQRILPDFLTRLESIETYIVNSSDLYRLFHEQGISLAYLPSAVQQTKSPFLKRIFLSQLVAIIFTSIFRSQLNNLYSSFWLSPQDSQELSLDEINTLLVDSTHTLVDMLFSYSNNAENTWKIIVQQCKYKYKVIVSKEDLIPGYLLASIIERMGIECQFRRSSFDKHQIDFFAKSNNLPRDMFTGFRIKIRRYDLSSISAEVETIQRIISSQPTPQNFQMLVNSLQLKREAIPNYLYPLEQPLLTYLCNFIPYSEHEQFQHLGIYNMILLEPHSYYSTKCSLLALKWCIKKKLLDEATRIYEMKELQNAFWEGQYNPAISQFYDFFAMYNASVGQYEQATQLAKLSLKNIMQVAGTSELPVADKHYQLGNIYFKMGRKEEALREYNKTKEILMIHQQTQISEFAVILLKLAVLFLNFGKITEAVNHSLEALKVFDSNQGTEQDQIGTFQILSRCYQITKKNQQLQNICDLAAEKFNATEDFLIFQRMVKLMIYVKLRNLSTPQTKAFITIVSKLQEQVSDYNQMQSFSFLNRKCQSQLLARKIEHFLQNIVYLYEEANKKDLFRRYRSLDANTRNEAQDMLVTFQAIGIIIGFGYIIGSLKEVYD